MQVGGSITFAYCIKHFISHSKFEPYKGCPCRTQQTGKWLAQELGKIELHN